MAKSDSTSVTIAGIAFGSGEVFGPRSLAAMFGPILPNTLTLDCTGAAPVAHVAQHLAKLHQEAIDAFALHSVILPRKRAHH